MFKEDVGLYNFDADFSSDEITVTSDGKGYKVKCAFKHTYSNSGPTIASLSFDIDDLSKIENQTAIISNVKAELTEAEDNPYGQVKWKLSSNAPFKMAGPLEKLGYPYKFYGNWEIQGSQFQVDALEYTYISNSKNSITTYDSYVTSNNNIITIRLVLPQ